MVLVLLVGIPLGALLCWAGIFDFRRRHAGHPSHDIAAQARRARGAAEGGGAFPSTVRL
jgi:hypothetical protein